MGRKSELTSEPETLFVLSPPLHHTRSAHGSTRTHSHAHTHREAFIARRKFRGRKQTQSRLGSQVTLLLRFAGYLSALTPEVAPNPTLTPSGLAHELCWDLPNI